MAKARFSELPSFKYHPSPFSSGALEDCDDACECCGLGRGYLYKGPVFCEAQVERVCPWCIADGSAHAKWGAQFTDATFLDSHGGVVDLPAEVYDEVLHRTPRCGERVPAGQLVGPLWRAGRVREDRGRTGSF